MIAHPHLRFRANNLADAERHIIACNTLSDGTRRDPRVSESIRLAADDRTSGTA